MSKPISVGDLVMVVRGHECSVAKAGGIPWTVTGIVEPIGGGYYCDICKRHSAWGEERAATGYKKGSHAPLSWLIRIDPPAIPETVEQREEISA